MNLRGCPGLVPGCFTLAATPRPCEDLGCPGLVAGRTPLIASAPSGPPAAPPQQGGGSRCGQRGRPGGRREPPRTKAGASTPRAQRADRGAAVFPNALGPPVLTGGLTPRRSPERSVSSPCPLR